MTAIDLSAERLTWLDLESTGIDPHEGEKLLQVAAIVTDGNLEELDEGFMIKIHYSEAEVAAMREAAVPFVRDMHDATDLWNSLPVEGVELEHAETKLYNYLLQFIPEARTSRLGGNSITLDRNFLAVYMPNVLAHLHYRSIDMTSVAGFMELSRPEIPYFEKKKTHDALDDIRESLEEARYYSKHLKSFTVPAFAG